MAYRQYPHAMEKAALKWRRLAERRCAHFAELYESGRWRHYYSDREIVEHLRESFAVARRWAAIAPRPGEPGAGR